MQLLNPRRTLVNASIDRRSNRQRPTNNRTNARQEARERLRPLFAVDDLHGRNVLPNPRRKLARQASKEFCKQQRGY